MIFETSKIPTNVSNGYYVDVTFMIDNSNRDITTRVGPLSEDAAKLFCRFLTRVGMSINNKQLTKSNKTEINFWQCGSLRTISGYFTDICKKDFKLYGTLSKEIDNTSFTWIFDKYTKDYAKLRTYNAIYINNNITYPVNVSVNNDDLYD